MAPSAAFVGAGGAQVNDQDVLNFALQLSYVEASFYNMAAFGQQARER
jgi:hypothetical protein